jgi:hypothetical protein
VPRPACCSRGLTARTRPPSSAGKPPGGWVSSFMSRTSTVRTREWRPRARSSSQHRAPSLTAMSLCSLTSLATNGTLSVPRRRAGNIPPGLMKFGLPRARTDTPMPPTECTHMPRTGSTSGSQERDEQADRGDHPTAAWVPLRWLFPARSRRRYRRLALPPTGHRGCRCCGRGRVRESATIRRLQRMPLAPRSAPRNSVSKR